MTFDPYLARLSLELGFRREAPKAIIPVKGSPQAIIMSVGDAVVTPAKEAKAEA